MTQILAANKARRCLIPSQRQQGFTLLELLVVSVLIILVIGITIPNLSSTDNSTFKAQVRRAVSTLTYARRVAVVKAQPQVAAFYLLDPEAVDYAARQQFIVDENIEARWVSERLALGYQKDLNAADEAIDTLQITFFPQGGSTGGILNFTLDELKARIKVDPITGRIAAAYNGEDFADAF